MTQEKKVDEFVDHGEDAVGEIDNVEEAHDVAEHIEFIVPQTDDPNTPAFTFRSVFLGVVFAVLLSFANTALSFRSAPFAISAVVAVIVSYPMGLFLAKVLPAGPLNPGPFSVKEHVLIYIMSSVSGQPYGIDNVITQMHPDLMGNTDINFIQSVGFVLVTQFLGYGFSGLTRRFLVKPTAMWWPGTIPTIAMFASFHKVDGAVTGEKYTWSRSTVFWISFVAMFAYEWIPEYFAPVLQAISISCLVAGRGSGPSGKLSPFNSLMGSSTAGLGLFGLTFDWTFIGSINFAQPMWANLLNAAGNIVFLWILTPIFYNSDVFGINAKLRVAPSYYFQTLNPAINSASLFVGNANGTKRQGSRVSPRYFYNVSDNYNINLTAYNNVAPVHLTSTFALTYASSFLTVTAALAHVALWYGKDIYRQSMNAFRQVRDEIDAQDKHVKMMEAYPDVPDWFYMAFMGVCTVGALAVSIWTPFNMPWWGIFFNIFLVGLFVVPYGAVQAIAGVPLYLNVVSEFIIGLMIPGQTVAVMAFKSWGTNNLIMALALSADLKIGQYLHIPPYAMVSAQFIGTFINAIVATAAAFYMVFNTGDLVGATSVDWSMINYQVFYSAGGIWGAIGPQRFFGIGSIYEGLMWCFLVGAICPVLPWLGNKFIVKSKYWHYINFAIFFQFYGVLSYQVYVVVPVLCNLFAQLYMFNRNKEFYQKYLFVMGSAFDAAGGVCSLVISMMSVAGISFTTRWALNPNTNNVSLDYYCYPGASYNDYDCSYYVAQGINATSDGTFCPGVEA
ncbi:UNVERIFIED_CONTAM: hypothetical protein HDU68_008900 [Siphonaria sp. JEL0065]|nr:hypothetical protein HDU68_008900 [Siphonaria sp. JEL0065]